MRAGVPELQNLLQTDQVRIPRLWQFKGSLGEATPEPTRAIHRQAPGLRRRLAISPIPDGGEG
jgi:hypothetical protein